MYEGMAIKLVYAGLVTYMHHNLVVFIIYIIISLGAIT
jgi:hypothetical protein